MQGYVETRDLFLHPALIVREFGIACYLRCVRRTVFERRPVTFLECV